MQGQQRLAHAPVVSVCKLLERHVGPLTESAPLLDQEIGNGPPPVLHPGAPAPGRLLDRVGPVWNAMRRPCAERGEGEAERLRALENQIHEREQIRGPLKQLVRYRASEHRLPHGLRRRLVRSPLGSAPIVSNRAHELSTRRRKLGSAKSCAPPDRAGERPGTNKIGGTIAESPAGRSEATAGPATRRRNPVLEAACRKVKLSRALPRFGRPALIDRRALCWRPNLLTPPLPSQRASGRRRPGTRNARNPGRCFPLRERNTTASSPT